MSRQLLTFALAVALGAAATAATPLGGPDLEQRVRPERRTALSWRGLIDRLGPHHLREVPDALERVDWIRLVSDLTHPPRLARRLADSIA
jgi:hypothetical protein